MIYEGAREPGASRLRELSEISSRLTHTATLLAAAHAGSTTEGGGVAVRCSSPAAGGRAICLVGITARR